MSEPIQYRGGTAIKDPGEDLQVSFNLFDECANYWEPNEQYGSGEYVRPRRSTGFAYTAGAAGLSGAAEPRWPKTPGQSVADGSLTWTAVAPAANGISAVSSPTATAEQTGITIVNVAVSESHKILATYQGGVHGRAYDVLFTYTLNGAARKFRQRVEVWKR